MLIGCMLLCLTGCTANSEKKRDVLRVGVVLYTQDDPFIYALTEQDVLPQTILFYNGGAKLTCEESPTLEDLKSLEAQGVEILTCGTCLNHYGLTDKLQVGSVTNMYVIAEKMTQAGNIVKP